MLRKNISHVAVLLRPDTFFGKYSEEALLRLANSNLLKGEMGKFGLDVADRENVARSVTRAHISRYPSDFFDADFRFSVLVKSNLHRLVPSKYPDPHRYPNDAVFRGC
ncbi:MAG: hypothetical protein ACI9BD_000760 [Candidatus Marinamargulisbacteria bacterium]|jgi:hypothetical protein